MIISVVIIYFVNLYFYLKLNNKVKKDHNHIYLSIIKEMHVIFDLDHTLIHATSVLPELEEFEKNRGVSGNGCEDTDESKVFRFRIYSNGYYW